MNGKLSVITAAVNELQERATAAAIRNNVGSSLAKLGILEKQIYSLTTDNGSNILKVGELMRRNFALPETFAEPNDEDELDVITEVCDSELREDVITAADGVITVRCAVHTLQLSVHDFFKTNFSATELVSKVRNVAKKTYKQNIRDCSSTITNLFLDWIVKPVGVQRF